MRADTGDLTSEKSENLSIFTLLRDNEKEEISEYELFLRYQAPSYGTLCRVAYMDLCMYFGIERATFMSKTNSILLQLFRQNHPIVFKEKIHIELSIITVFIFII